MTMSDRREIEEDPAAARAALRAFVRTHHPDVGGDPEVFAAGLAELREAELRARRNSELAAPADRGDAPVVVVRHPRGLCGLWSRWRSRRARRKRGPRVV